MAGPVGQADQLERDGGVPPPLGGAEARQQQRQLDVALGQAVGTEREVVSGLKAGERVVVAPSPTLKDGDAVRVAEGSR